MRAQKGFIRSLTQRDQLRKGFKELEKNSFRYKFGTNLRGKSPIALL